MLDMENCQASAAGRPPAASVSKARATLRIAAAATATTLALAACGGGDSATVAQGPGPAAPGASGSSAAPAASEGAAPAAAATVGSASANTAQPATGKQAAAAQQSSGNPASSSAQKAPAAPKASGAPKSPAAKASAAAAAPGAAQVPEEQKAPPITSGTIKVDMGNGKTVQYDAVKPIKMVFFNFGSGYTYTAAIVKGAQERARQLGVQLDVDDARVNPGLQAQQMQSAITSHQYVGGFVLPIAHDTLCGIATDLAPSNNFMLVVDNTAFCGRRAKEAEDLWAPGTLAFNSADQEISAWTQWGEYIRKANPGPQKVILLVGLPTTGLSDNANDAFHKIQKDHPEFQLTQTVFTDFSQQNGQIAMNGALTEHPDTTIVASIYSELTKGTVNVLKQQGKQGKVKVYDVGADSSVLPLIKSGEVEMTRPYYPVTQGATAIQAIYDARVGRKPIIRFYAHSGHPTPKMQGDAPFLAVTRQNLEEFQQSGLSEY